MGKNINKRTNTCIFIDLDGVIVEHNYDPEHTPEVFIMSTVEVLQHNMKLGLELCLLTARTYRHTESVVYQLAKKYGIKFGAVICDLPAGIRVLINDCKNENELTAYAVNVKRNKGLGPNSFWVKI